MKPFWDLVPCPLRAAVVSVAAAIVLASSGAAEDCPESRVQLSRGSVAFDDPRAVLDTTLTTPAFTSHAAFDLIAGTIGISMTPAVGESMFVSASDVFEVVGPPAGTPVIITMVFEFAGAMGPPGCVEGDCGAEFRAVAFNEFFIGSRTIAAPSSPLKVG